MSEQPKVDVQPWALEALDLDNKALMAVPAGVYVPPYRAVELNGWRISVSILAANIGF
jgi:hypothetical protein